MKGAEFFNKLDPGSRLIVTEKDGESEVLIKMSTICRTLFGKKIEFNAIFSNTAKPYSRLLTSLDIVTVVS